MLGWHGGSPCTYLEAVQLLLVEGDEVGHLLLLVLQPASCLSETGLNRDRDHHTEVVTLVLLRDELMTTLGQRA